MLKEVRKERYSFVEIKALNILKSNIFALIIIGVFN